MKTMRCALLMAFTLIFFTALGQSVSVTMLPPNGAVVEGRKFTVTIRVANGGQVSAPDAPQIKDCALIYGPAVSQSMSYSSVNGNVTQSRTTDYTFTYRADKAGTTTIPAVAVNVDGKKMGTSPYTLKVLPPDASSQQQPGYTNPGPGYQPGTSQPPATVSPDDMFIRIITDRTSAYEQQAIVVTVKIYSRLNISTFRTLAQPTFDGFFSEELSIQQNIAHENYNGKNYFTCDLRRCVLYPQKAGTLTISSGEYELTVLQEQLVNTRFGRDVRYQEVPVKTKTNSITVNVQPLPEPKPEGFSGAVGSYTATADLSPLDLKTNEVATYTVKISGSGNIKYLKAPQIELPHGIDRLTPKTSIDANYRNGDMSGTFTCEIPLMPQDPGDIQIPAWDFVYFNPADKEYHTISMPAYAMHVEKGANVTTQVEQTQIASGMTDIRHITPIVHASQHRPEYAFRSVGYWLLYLASAIALAVVMIAYRRHMRLSADIKGRKMSRAMKTAMARLRAARQAMSRQDMDKFYLELNQAMAGYISDRLDIPASGLVRANIASQLSTLGVDQSTADSAIDVLDQCEMYRFAPAASQVQQEQLLKQAEEAIRSIQQASKGKAGTQNQ